MVIIVMMFLKKMLIDRWRQRDNAGDPIGWTNAGERASRCREVCLARQKRNTKHNANAGWMNQPGQGVILQQTQGRNRLVKEGFDLPTTT